jgi:hypothetical protein
MMFVYRPPSGSRKQSVIASLGIRRYRRSIGHDHVDLLRKRFLEPLPGMCKTISPSSLPGSSARKGSKARLPLEEEFNAERTG